MKMFLDFLKENWQIILAAIFMVISFVVSLIKKKSTYNEADNIILRVFEAIPHWIDLAELTGEEGSTKKVLVMESIKKYVKDQFSFTLPESLIALFDSYVESVLNTPHKKEVKDL